MTGPGWYYAEGDPAGTIRYWDGVTWTTEPQPDPNAAPLPAYGSPAAPGPVHAYPSTWAAPTSPPVERGVWEWYTHILKSDYANFRGRARRKEFFSFHLVNAVIMMALVGPGVALTEGTEGFSSVLGVVPLGLGTMFVIAMAVPSVAVAVRRLHDTNRSGAWYFLSLVPYIGAFILLIVSVIDGTIGPNQYGPDPKPRH